MLNTFDARTRAAIQTNLQGFGDAFAGRGQDLNLAIEALNPLLIDLTPVMTNLASPRTGLTRLVRALGRTCRELAPVAEQQAALFRNMATTFGALESVSSDLQQSIVDGPPALEAGINGFPRQRPFLVNSTGFFHDLRPGVASLDPAAGDLADALTVGTPTLYRVGRVQPAPRSRRSSALQAFAEDPLAQLGDLRPDDVRGGSPSPRSSSSSRSRRSATTRRSSCATRRACSSTGGKTGTTQRFAIVATPDGPEQRGQPVERAGERPDGDELPALQPVPEHRVAGPDEGVRGGQRAVAGRPQVIGNVPGNQGTVTEKTKRSASLR